jgi:hypothetical protein
MRRKGAAASIPEAVMLLNLFGHLTVMHYLDRVLPSCVDPLTDYALSWAGLRLRDIRSPDAQPWPQVTLPPPWQGGVSVDDVIREWREENRGRTGTES